MPLAKDALISGRKKRRKKESNYERKEAIERNYPCRQCNYVKEQTVLQTAILSQGRLMYKKKKKKTKTEKHH